MGTSHNGFHFVSVSVFFLVAFGERKGCLFEIMRRCLIERVHSGYLPHNLSAFRINRFPLNSIIFEFPLFWGFSFFLYVHKKQKELDPLRDGICRRWMWWKIRIKVYAVTDEEIRYWIRWIAFEVAVMDDIVGLFRIDKLTFFAWILKGVNH